MLCENLECQLTILKLKLVDILELLHRKKYVNVAHQIT